jgi:hypothetical protein
MASTAARPCYTVEEWLAEGRKRFGPDYLKWRFVCPVCGHEQSLEDFKAVGADPQRAYVECIGRAAPELKQRDGLDAEPGTPGPCNWAAFGLFGTLNRGTQVQREGQEKPGWVFDFAEAPA